MVPVFPAPDQKRLQQLRNPLARLHRQPPRNPASAFVTSCRSRTRQRLAATAPGASKIEPRSGVRCHSPPHSGLPDRPHSHY